MLKDALCWLSPCPHCQKWPGDNDDDDDDYDDDYDDDDDQVPLHGDASSDPP